MISIKTDIWCIDNIKAAIFDKDGTIIDSHLYWGRIIERRASALLSAYSLSDKYYEKLCSVMGYSLNLKKLMPEGPIALVSREEVIDIIDEYLKNNNVQSDIEQISEIFSKEHKFFAEEIFEYIKVLPGVTDFLLRLKNNGIKIAVVTGDSVSNTELILEYLGIFRYFDVIIGKESTVESKITGIPVLIALEKLHIEPQSAICIGDAPVDIIMAMKSGCKAGIGVTTGQVLKEDLLEHTLYVTSSFDKMVICE